MNTLSKPPRASWIRAASGMAGLVVVLGSPVPAGFRAEQPDETRAVAHTAPARAAAPVRNYQITASEGGIVPGHVRVRRGETVRITFVSRDDTYGIRFKDFGIKEKLTAEKPVVIELRPTTAGTFEFRCARAWGVSRLTNNGALFVTE